MGIEERLLMVKAILALALFNVVAILALEASQIIPLEGTKV
ncbi:hypothetical protein [Pedobacter aquae]|nr:hypothetical protein [Pedobacter aquae]